MEKEHYLNECKEHFNEIGLSQDTTVCRLIGFADDGEDYYWITAHPSHKCEAPKIIYESMVGPWVSLKGIYPRYEQLESMFVWWNCPPHDEFILDERKNTLPWLPAESVDG